MRFADRDDAGRQLADLVRDRVAPGALVLGLPRGGVPLAAPIARIVGGDLGVVVARKLRVVDQPELAFGAVAVWRDQHAVVRNERVIEAVRVSPEHLAAARDAEVAAARSSAAVLMPHPPDCSGRTVVVVDDGLATGATMRAALTVLRAARAARLVVAVPVGAGAELAELPADDVLCRHVPKRFGSVSAHYADFAQVTDETVRTLLAQHRPTDCATGLSDSAPNVRRDDE